MVLPEVGEGLKTSRPERLEVDFPGHQRTLPKPKQPAFPGLRQTMKMKQSRREKFLAEMDEVSLWTRLLALIEPHYPKARPKGGRPPMPLETKLRALSQQSPFTPLTCALRLCRTSGGFMGLDHPSASPFTQAFLVADDISVLKVTFGII